MDESQTPVDRVWSSPRVLVLPFSHSFPPLRFLSLSRCVIALRRRRNRKGKDLNHKPRISSKMATNAMLAHGALTASPASVSLNLSLKNRKFSTMSLYSPFTTSPATHSGPIYKCMVRISILRDLYELSICCCMKNVFLIHIDVWHHLGWKCVISVVLSLPRFESTLVLNCHYNVLV